MSLSCSNLQRLRWPGLECSCFFFFFEAGGDCVTDGTGLKVTTVAAVKGADVDVKSWLGTQRFRSSDSYDNREYFWGEVCDEIFP